MKTWLAAALATLMFATSPVSAQTDKDTTGQIEVHFASDPAPVVEAINAIQKAVADYDAEAFAQWVRYPFRVEVEGQIYVFDGPKGVIEYFDAMMTEEIRTAIINQQYKDFFVNSDGLMFGHGQLWLSEFCRDDSCETYDIRIVALQSARK